MNTPLWKDILDFAQQTTADVGAELLQQFGQVQGIEKADGSLVTAADKWADKELQQRITARFPQHETLTEETAKQFPDATWCWIVDPIDGTTNFTRGVPLWGVSMALLYRGTPVFGYVHFPPTGQSFHAFYNTPAELDGHPMGAYLNGSPIAPTRDRPGGNQFFNLCARSTHILTALEEPFPCKLRMLGVATYNILTVAAGIAIGGVEATPKIWDIAAVWAIVQASGAVWISLNNERIFPLVPGRDDRQKPYPTLTVSSPDWVETFQPWVSSSYQ